MHVSKGDPHEARDTETAAAVGIACMSIRETRMRHTIKADSGSSIT